MWGAKMQVRVEWFDCVPPRLDSWEDIDNLSNEQHAVKLRLEITNPTLWAKMHQLDAVEFDYLNERLALLISSQK